MLSAAIVNRKSLAPPLRTSLYLVLSRKRPAVARYGPRGKS